LMVRANRPSFSHPSPSLVYPSSSLSSIASSRIDNSLPVFRDSNSLQFARSAPVCFSTRKLIHSAEIATHYTTYSIRHATISKLYSIFPDKTQVNAFLGHSQLAGSSSLYCLRQPKKWGGYHLGASSPSSDSSISTETPSEMSVRNDELSLSSEDTSSSNESPSTSGP
jgi:hypothetical protein